MRGGNLVFNQTPKGNQNISNQLRKHNKIMKYVLNHMQYRIADESFRVAHKGAQIQRNSWQDETAKATNMINNPTKLPI